MASLPRIGRTQFSLLVLWSARRCDSSLKEAVRSGSATSIPPPSCLAFHRDLDPPQDVMRPWLPALRKARIFAVAFLGLDGILDRSRQDLSVRQTHLHAHVKRLLANRGHKLPVSLLHIHPVVLRIGHGFAHPVRRQVHGWLLRRYVLHQERRHLVLPVNTGERHIEIDGILAQHHVASIRPRGRYAHFL